MIQSAAVSERSLADAEPEDGDAPRPRGADWLRVDPGEAGRGEADAVAEQDRQYVHLAARGAARRGLVLLWRFASSRSDSDAAERRAQRLIGGSFYVLAAYVAVEAVRSLVGGHHPDASGVGIGLSVVTLLTMPPLAIAIGERLGSSATKSEGRQNMLCAYLSGTLLVGLVANAALGWWWADPITGLVIAAVALREGREAWRGDSCGCCAPAL